MTEAFGNLHDFIDALRRGREIVEVSAPVDADQEIAEVHRRVISAGGPALLFTNVKGSPYPVATNLFGTTKRVELAFGSRPGKFVRDAAEFALHALPPTPGKLWDARGILKQAVGIGMKTVAAAPVAEVRERPRLTKLPLLKLWPEDGGHFVTLPLVLTTSPTDGKPNLGMYRIQRHDDHTTGIHWQIGKGGGFHYAEAEARDEALPLTLMVGGPPALMLGAIAPLPEGVPELLLSSMALGKRLPVLRMKGWPHPIPAECDFAFLGHVPPRVRRPEGPFGDHYGYYSLAHPYPVFRAKKALRRRNPVYPATVVGKPRQEDFFLGDYLQELLSPLFPLVMPSVRALWSYGETGFHSLSAAVVRDRYPREAMMSAFRILGEGQLSLSKFLFVTDTPMDLRDFPRVLEHMLARVNWETDLFVFSNLSMDTLDYAGPEVNKGSKGVVLGLGPAVRELPRAFDGTPSSGVRDVRVFCPGCVVVGGATYAEDKELPARVAADPAFREWQLIVLCDRPAQAAASAINFLWTAFTRFNPATDLHSAAQRIVQGHIAYGAPLVLDARMKPWYPKEVFAASKVAETVTGRWKEYFQGTRVEMGSSDLGSLTAG